MEFGVGGLGIGDWGLGPIPNPQPPIPNPQSPNLNYLIKEQYISFKKYRKIIYNRI